MLNMQTDFFSALTIIVDKNFTHLAKITNLTECVTGFRAFEILF